MDKTQAALPGYLTNAGTLLVVSAVVQCLSWMLSGWNSDTQLLIVTGLVTGLTGILLLLKMSWIRYPAFLIALFGMVLGYARVGDIQVADWIIWLLIVLDLIIACLLFASIWKGRQPVAA